MMQLPPCPLCHHPLSIEWDDSNDNYIISFCNNQSCMQNDLCSYTAKFINQQINYESYILQDIMLEIFHQKETSRLSHLKRSQDHQFYDKSDAILIQKIIPPNYHKAKLYLLLS
jgi:hypothetical protein